MKRLLLAMLFLPLLSFGQKVEISEMIGVNRAFTESYLAFGLSNQVSVGYYLWRRFSISAFYEFGTMYKSDPYNSPPDHHTFGLMPEYHARHFYCGLSIAYSKLADQPDRDRREIMTQPPGAIFVPVFKDKPALSYGAHIGFSERLSRRLLLKQQLGYCKSTLKWGTEKLITQDASGNITYASFSDAQFFMYYYLTVGVAYRFKSL